MVSDAWGVEQRTPPASSPTCSPPSKSATRKSPSSSATPEPSPKSGPTASSAPPSPSPKPSTTPKRKTLDDHHARGGQGRPAGPSRRDRSEAQALDGPGPISPDDQTCPAPPGRDLRERSCPTEWGSTEPILNTAWESPATHGQGGVSAS